MSKRVLAILSLAVLIAGCDSRATSPEVAYTTPGWYHERPRITLAVGPEIFAGPFTYDQCEAKRVNEFDPAMYSSRALRSKAAASLMGGSLCLPARACHGSALVARQFAFNRTAKRGLTARWWRR